jgi:SsrA-binding protein
MTTIATNKKAFHNYILRDKWECGIALNGGEVKSIRAGGASFTDAFAYIDKGELYLYNLHINPYEQASYMNEEPARPRKLLVHAKELERMNGHLTRGGLTLIPTKMYFNKRGWVKVEIAVGQGKKLYDKREDIKKRDIKREIDRSINRQK